MRILYVDIDSQRPDHLGCYGYHRETSPNIDRIAAQGVRFNNCYATDVPCLPSRTALFSGRCGFHTGVVNHGGVAGQPFVEGPGRGFRDVFGQTSFPQSLRDLGYRTVTISPFGERHSAWHWYAGMNEVINPGKGGMERADEVSPLVMDWLERNGREDNWFMHFNFWDPHTPYRTPEEMKQYFGNDPLPAWYTEEVRQEHWAGVGPHSAREINGFEPTSDWVRQHEQQPSEASSMEEARKMFDGYDRGTRYADQHLGFILQKLEELGIADDTAIIISGDHGENLGELNVYGDHQLADHITCRVPLIMKWPGMTDNQAGRVDNGLLYHLDFAATMTGLAGGQVAENWDGVSFADQFRAGGEQGRDYLVVSQGAWSVQRGVRFGDYFMMRIYHDGYHGFPHEMLFDVANDPHEQHDLAPERPDLIRQGNALLEQWYTEMMETASHDVDPLMTVMREGGAFHSRGALPQYIQRLRETDRADWADRFEKRKRDWMER